MLIYFLKFLTNLFLIVYNTITNIFKEVIMMDNNCYEENNCGLLGKLFNGGNSCIIIIAIIILFFFCCGGNNNC